VPEPLPYLPVNGSARRPRRRRPRPAAPRNVRAPQSRAVG